MTVHTAGIRLVNSTMSNGDTDVKPGELHPSRIQRIFSQTGILTMDNENSPRVSAIAWVMLVMITGAVIMAYLLGQSNGIVLGIEKGEKMSEMKQLKEDLNKLADKQEADEEQAKRVKAAKEMLKEK